MKWIAFLAVLLSGHCWSFSRPREISIEPDYKLDARWRSLGESDEEAIRALVKILEKSPTGRSVIAKANARAAESGETFYDIVSAGEGSLTDTTLIRKFSAKDPHQMIYESKSRVSVNRDLSVVDAVLDLAHELTHYIYREPFNPYTTSFKLKEFVENTIDGRGGEVDAFLVECRVLLDIFPEQKRQRENCERVRDQKSGELSKDRGVAEFFKVGPYIDRFRRSLSEHQVKEEEFKVLSDDTPHFISSAYGLPYPVAALEEYVGIMGRACVNDWKRLSLIKKQMEFDSPGRVIASESQSGLSRSGQKEKWQEIDQNYQFRCAQFGPTL